MAVAPWPRRGCGAVRAFTAGAGVMAGFQARYGSRMEHALSRPRMHEVLAGRLDRRSPPYHLMAEVHGDGNANTAIAALPDCATVQHAIDFLR